ncbi:uncharacterized protein GJ701_000048 [Geothlypis trichas]
MSSWDFPSASPHGRPRHAAARSPGSLVPRCAAGKGRRDPGTLDPRAPTFLSLHGEAESEATQQQQHQDSGAAGPGSSEGAAAAHAAGPPLPRRGAWGSDGTGARVVPRSRSCSPLLLSRGSDQLLSGALPCAAPSSMLEGGRRGLRAHVRAPLRAGCCLPPPPPPPPPPTSAPPAAGGCGCTRACRAAGAGCGTGCARLRSPLDRGAQGLPLGTPRRRRIGREQGGEGRRNRQRRPRRGGEGAGSPPVPEYRMREGCFSGKWEEALTRHSDGVSCASVSAHCLSSYCWAPLRRAWILPLDTLPSDMHMHSYSLLSWAAWFMGSLLFTRTPRAFSTELLSSRPTPSLCWCMVTLSEHTVELFRMGKSFLQHVGDCQQM